MRCEVVVRGLPRGLVQDGGWLASPSEAPILDAPELEAKREAPGFTGPQAAPNLGQRSRREER